MNLGKLETPFLFDKSVPRELYFKVKRRLNLIGYNAIWLPFSPLKDDTPEALLNYCLRRNIRVLITFRRSLLDLRGIKVVIPNKRARKSVNKMIEVLFTKLRDC